MKDKQTGLTIKQTAFAKAYAIDSDAGKAYLTAGYKRNGYERQSGYKLLQNDRILAIIAKEKAKTVVKSELTREKVLQHIEDGMTEALDRKNLPAIARFAELEARTLGMLTDNINTTDLTRQKELDEKEKAEASELARLRLSTKYGLEEQKSITFDTHETRKTWKENAG